MRLKVTLFLLAVSCQSGHFTK